VEGEIQKTLRGDQMRQLTVISGKGGTGKTTLTGAFAALAEGAVIADCDVDAPDLHLILHPEIKEEKKFSGMKLASINHEKCINCRKCYENCKFDAITDDLRVNELKCEGCGVCVYVCPVNAVEFKERDSGILYISETRFGPMVHARLNIGEETSGKLVSLVRSTAREIAEKRKKDLIIIDGSPGIGCPVIASLTDSDLALIVTESTLSGLHDLKRVYDVSKHFGIKTMVCINKYDINRENSEKIEKFCMENGIEIAGEIPYDPDFTKAMIEEKTIIEYNDNPLVREIWEKIKEVMQSLS